MRRRSAAQSLETNLCCSLSDFFLRLWRILSAKSFLAALILQVSHQKVFPEWLPRSVRASVPRPSMCSPAAAGASTAAGWGHLYICLHLFNNDYLLTHLYFSVLCFFAMAAAPASFAGALI